MRVDLTKLYQFSWEPLSATGPLQIGQNFIIHRRFPYSRGRTWNDRAHFLYGPLESGPATVKEETCHRVVHKRRKHKDLYAVKNNANLTRKYYCLINSERMKGGRGTKNFMKYAIWPSSFHDAQVMTNNESNSRFRSQVHKILLRTQGSAWKEGLGDPLKQLETISDNAMWKLLLRLPPS